MLSINRKEGHWADNFNKISWYLAQWTSFMEKPNSSFKKVSKNNESLHKAKIIFSKGGLKTILLYIVT